jgi:integrase
VDLGALCGLRQGQAAGLSVDRVDFLRRQLKVDRQLVTSHDAGRPTSFGPPKTARSFRSVPLADAAVNALAGYVEQFGTGADGLLLHEDGAPVGSDRFGHVWRRTRQDVLLARARVHNLRHTYASVLLAGGVSVPAAAEHLGHTPAILLDVYAHLIPADLDRARGAVEAAFAQRAEDSLRTEDRSCGGARPADLEL